MIVGTIDIVSTWKFDSRWPLMFYTLFYFPVIFVLQKSRKYGPEYEKSWFFLHKFKTLRKIWPDKTHTTKNSTQWQENDIDIPVLGSSIVIS